MRVLRASDRTPESWRNGRGVTREVARLGPADRFDWRVSVATIAENGPFSHFPDMIRSFVLLQGAVRLCGAGADAVDMRAASAPITFEGAADIDCTLIEGPASALNIMTRCGKYTARVVPFERQTSSAPSGAIALFTAPVMLAAESLASGDALLLEPGKPFPDMPPTASGWHILFSEETP